MKYSQRLIHCRDWCLFFLSKDNTHKLLQNTPEVRLAVHFLNTILGVYRCYLKKKKKKQLAEVYCYAFPVYSVSVPVQFLKSVIINWFCITVGGLSALHKNSTISQKSTQSFLLWLNMPVQIRPTVLMCLCDM